MGGYAIEIEITSQRYRSQAEHTLGSVVLRVAQGEKLLIVGQSGSGKSTLAHMINGLIPHSYPADVAGTVRVCGVEVGKASLGEVSRTVGTVLQDPDGQFVALTVGEDIAFALENDCVARDEMLPRVRDTAALVHMGGFLTATPHELSGGQKQRVTLAGVLVDDAQVLIFDEPLANLDPAAGRMAIELIDQIHRDLAKTVVIIEHRLEDVLHCPVDRVVLVEDGEIAFDGGTDALLKSGLLPEKGIREPLYLTALKYAGIDPAHLADVTSVDALDMGAAQAPLTRWFQSERRPAEPVKGPALLSVRDLRLTYEGGVNALRGVSFDIRRGEAVALLGKNGAGKTTLSRVVCGMEQPDGGSMRYDGQDLAKLSIAERGKRIGLVMQDPNHMLSKPMIFDEVALGLRARGMPEDQVKEKVHEMLKVCGLYPMRNWPTGALSFGQKKRVTVASVLALGCEMLILDEPTAGQDYAHYTEIMEFLLRLRREMGLTLLFITHDMHLALEYTDRAIVMADGELVADDVTPVVLDDDAVVARASLRKTSLSALARRAGLGGAALIERFIAEDREVRGHG